MRCADRAARLLRAFGVQEPLIGDLIEQDGRSCLWLWRQTVTAIALRVLTVVRTNPIGSLATAFFSSAALAVWFAGALWLYREINLTTIASWRSPHEFAAIRSHILNVAWNVYCVPLHVAWLTGSLIAGRMVARYSRDGAALVVLCAMFALPVDVLFGWPYVHAVVHPQPLLPMRFYIGHVTDALASLVGLPLGMVAAGLSVPRCCSM